MSNQQHPMDNLIAVMRALRDPKGGCPWDLAQDFKSIAPYTIEEAYEVADAIDRDDMVNLREELGDLLLQSVYHAQMAAEAGHFDIYDVIRDIAGKMISRHPHVFGDAKAASASDVNTIWEERKDAEKAATGGSVLEGVPKALPALLRAAKLQKKAAKTGFEWPEFSQILNKLSEELEELYEARESHDPDHIAEEFGDILFVLVNCGRKLGVNAEEALRRANDKFENRFRALEEKFKSENKVMADASLDQMVAGWKEIKTAV